MEEQDSAGPRVGEADAAGPDTISRSIRGMTCFVVMPYGRKTDPVTAREINFDAVYRDFIQKSVVELGLTCIRSDEVNQSGLIHREMIDHIINSDVAIVDITTGNPNVMYELGVRHTAWKSGTIIVRLKDSQIPFNIAGMRAMDYVEPAEGAPAERLEQQREVLKTNIRNSLHVRSVDSLVHSIVSGLNVSRRPRPIPTQSILRYSDSLLKEKGKAIEIITGDLALIDQVDAWVNPENTRMEMGRLHDNSVSSLVRYLGARKDKRGHVVHDTITRSLRRGMGRRHWAGVEPRVTICTTPGELRRTNKVRLLVHVAAQHSEPTQGYSLIRGYVGALINALVTIDEVNGSGGGKGGSGPLKSVLFPLFGTRNWVPDPQDVAFDHVQAAREYLCTRKTEIQRVCFLAYTDADLLLCQTAMQRNDLAPVG